MTVRMREPTVEVFLEDVANHKMEVLLDQGIYRHIRFRKPGDSNHWFEIITWPNFLTVAGDMGTWTFSRLPDMFDFFRSSKEMSINPSYWAEKLQNGTHGGHDNAKVFDGETFGGQLLDQLENYYSFEGEELAEITQAVKDEILNDDWSYELMTAARDFSHTFSDGRKFQFDTCELPSGKGYCYHFIWCLYAIVWGIRQHDELRGKAAA